MTEKDLRAGDCLLYKPSDFYGWLIAIKTWHAISHVEVYIGAGRSVGAKQSGVNEYPVRLDIETLLRPSAPFDVKAAMATFDRKYRGQKYDYLGLIRFAWRAKVVPERFDNAQFCSELATRVYRAGGLDPFNGEDADAIAPFQFLLSDKFVKVERT
jgi:uncharacterized protein YycO